MPDNSLTMSIDTPIEDLFTHFEVAALVEGTTIKKCRSACNKLKAWAMDLSETDRRKLHITAPAGCDLFVRDLHKLTINAWQKWMQTTLSNASVRSYFGAASQVCYWGVEQEIINENPFDKCKRIQAVKKNVKVLDQDEIDDLCDAAAQFARRDPSAKVRWVAMIEIANKSGLRVGEIWNLRWEDINLDKAEIDVRAREDKPFEYWEWHTKNYLDRCVPVSQEALNALYRLKQLADWRYPFLKRVTCERMLKMVGDLTEMQRKYPYNNFYRELREITRFADGKRFAVGKSPISKGGMHIFRHTAITRWAEAGVHLKFAQNQAGHLSDSTTSRIYTHVNSENAKSSIRRTF